MNKAKYKLWEITRYGISGETDLKEGIGKIVDINGCTLLRCTQGHGVVSIDFREMKVSAGCLVVLTGDLPFIPIELSRDFHAYYISVPKALADETFYKVASSFWDLLYKHPVLPTTPEQDRLLKHWFIQTDWIINHCDTEQAKDVVRNNFYNLFVAIDNEMRRTGIEEVSNFSKNRSWKLYNDFYTLLSRHHTKHHDVKYYADKLHITPDYLYKLFHRIENISPKEMIDRFVIVSIKILLQNTDLSIKNIAAELHFDDPPYMCRFFRRMTGMSPLEYRDSVKK
ncbi:AraC family transcriptional regulator [Butyricimonas synergistica]|uniref:AraC family transcriptional regulator n=1 Tax=Butyricimonas synergistica TaxID=544644 RepID=UPI00035E95F7|nr:AraC family transcriptional regulator [Butyricimonas synergistica]